MKTKTIIFLLIGLLVISSSVIVFQNKGKAAAGPPTVVFSGDDILQDGGTNDAYDSLIVFDITSAQALPDEWLIEYSNDGSSWLFINEENSVYTSESDNRRIYYWSTTKIYAPTLYFRAQTMETGDLSDTFQATLSLSHRYTNLNASYFVESFTTSTYIEQVDNVEIETDMGKAVLAEIFDEGFLSGSITSKNLLESIDNNPINKVTVRPVQINFEYTISYQFSNNNIDWFPVTFTPGIMPTAQEVTFSDTQGDELYWKVDITPSGTPSLSMMINQLRFQWQENYPPQACFTVEPPNSLDVYEDFAYNARCTTDYETPRDDIQFRWDFESDETWDTGWQLGSNGGYSINHTFNSTSTATTTLEVKDGHDATDQFSFKINDWSVASSIYGWAWSSNYGWISLNCDNIYEGEQHNHCYDSSYGLTLRPSDQNIYGWAWSPNIGWLCFGETCSGTPPWGDTKVLYDASTGEVQGWGKFETYSDDGWLALRNPGWGFCSADPGDDLCVRLDINDLALSGYGWNGFTEGGVDPLGVGWVQFSQGQVNAPWLETKFGLVYGFGSFSGSFGTPEGRYNATYCIRYGDAIQNFSSEYGCQEQIDESLPYPAFDTNFDKSLAIYQKEEITAGPTDDLSELLASTGQPGQLILDNKVYEVTGGTGDYYIESPLTFYNARYLDSSGAGTIVINGDLHINSNLYYEENTVTAQIENLASLAWIIKGDLFIDPTVTNVVGNFIVLERTGFPGSGGKFYTGDDSASHRQLVVYGLVIAKEFYLERHFKMNREPSEKFIYDGRVIVNTPPGLEDLAQGLPSWRETLATTQIQ
ncbi:hypothetical protein KKF32_04685 [Patescibacteria group bacterium]|nr:hypothetical protein [Patescibacteria group bacterium]